MEIKFGSFGFKSAVTFLIKDNRQLCLGILYCNPNDYEFWVDDYAVDQYIKKDKYLTLSEFPTSKYIVSEYIRQLKEHGISINKEIVYAG